MFLAARADSLSVAVGERHPQCALGLGFQQRLSSAASHKAPGAVKMDRLPLPPHAPASILPRAVLHGPGYTVRMWEAHASSRGLGNHHPFQNQTAALAWAEWNVGVMDSVAWLIPQPLKQKDAQAFSSPGFLALSSIPDVIPVFLWGGPGLSGY